MDGVAQWVDLSAGLVADLVAWQGSGEPEEGGSLAESAAVRGLPAGSGGVARLRAALDAADGAVEVLVPCAGGHRHRVRVADGRAVPAGDQGCGGPCVRLVRDGLAHYGRRPCVAFFERPWPQRAVWPWGLPRRALLASASDVLVAAGLAAALTAAAPDGQDPLAVAAGALLGRDSPGPADRSAPGSLRELVEERFGPADDEGAGQPPSGGFGYPLGPWCKGKGEWLMANLHRRSSCGLCWSYGVAVLRDRRLPAPTGGGPGNRCGHCLRLLAVPGPPRTTADLAAHRALLDTVERVPGLRGVADEERAALDAALAGAP